MPRFAATTSFKVARFFLMLWCTVLTHRAGATVLWSDPGPHLAHDTGPGTDILHGAIKRDASSSGTLYFKFEVDPLSDVSTELYFAAFQLFEGDTERLAVGNSLKAWAYSAFNTLNTGENNQVTGDIDLRSSRPEAYGQGDVQPYELPRRGIKCTIVFKVQYIPDGDDLITAWMNPDLRHGATEENQPENLVTHFKANASFDQIRLRHGGIGGGWIFSDMEIATSFNDLIVPHFWQRWWFITLAVAVLVSSVGVGVRMVERRKFQLKLQRAEQERALERERTRIAQDLHDDLGSSLTRISLLSGLLQADKDSPEPVKQQVKKIAESADQTVRSLEEIVWAVRPGSDTLQSLVEYIAHFAKELFESDLAQIRLDLPHDLPARALPPELRHNIFLVVKEALTNALKYSNAAEVHVQAKVAGDMLEIMVQDNGKGFDPAASGEEGRHGLENMVRRAEAIGGNLNLQSNAGVGTTMTLSVKLP